MADRLTQEALETLIQGASKARETQIAIEVLIQVPTYTTIGLTQVALEVLVPAFQGNIFSASII